MFDPNVDDLYAGLSAVRLPVETYELGQGVVLSRTYGHLMQPMMMAFAPAAEGKAHPTPWSAVRGSSGVDLHVQLNIPRTFAQWEWFDRLNTVWWIATLIRLKFSPAVTVPAISDRPFAQVPSDWARANLLGMETNRRRLVISAPAKQEIEEADLSWLRDNWIRGGRLMGSSEDFSAAFQAFDFSANAGNAALALMCLWGGLEQLFSPSKQELRFRISASIASFLEPPGKARLDLHKKIQKLYDARSAVAHSAEAGGGDELVATYSLLRRTLMTMIEQGTVPSREENEKRIFGCA